MASMRSILESETDAETILRALYYSRRYGILRAARRFGTDTTKLRGWRSALAKLCSPRERGETSMRIVSCYTHKEITLVEVECDNCGAVAHIPADANYDFCPYCAMPLGSMHTDEN